MWAPVAPRPLWAPQPSDFWKPRTNPGQFKPFTVKASFFDYPLASRILVKNIPYSFGESNLLKEFSSFGQIAEVKLVKDEETNISKGYAFIQYTCQDDAVVALESMDGQKLGGRVIYVELARPGKVAFRGSPRTCGPPGEKLSSDKKLGRKKINMEGPET